MTRYGVGIFGLLLAGCGGGSPASFEALQQDALSFTEVLDSPTTTSLLSLEFPPGSAQFDGSVVVFESSEQGGETIEEFGIVGAASFHVDFDESNLSVTTSDFYSYSPPETGIANATAGAPVSAELQVVQSGAFSDTGNTGFFASATVDGTVTKPVGEVATYDATADFGLYASEGELLSGIFGVGGGTSFATGRDDLDVSIIFVGD